MSHISKFVTPGSKRVASHVVGNYNYSTLDPNVRAGFELGTFPCERSTRQLFTINDWSQLELATPTIDMEKTANNLWCEYIY